MKQLIKGFSLIELMVSIAIGMVLMVALISVVLSTNNSQRELSKSSRQLENGRYAMDLLGTEIRHAGFYGQYDSAVVPANTPNPCATSIADLTNDLGIPVQGYDAQSATFALPACLPTAAYKTDTDILVIHRASTTATAVASLEDNEVYIQGGISGFVLNLGSNAASFTLTNTGSVTVLPIRKYRVDIYFISPCRDFDDACLDEIPTLKRLELTAGAAGLEQQMVTLVEGVEDLQLYFGLDTTVEADQDGSPDDINDDGNYYLADPGDPTTAAGRQTWANVMAVQVYLLARNIDSSSGYKDTKTYVMGPTPADAATSAYSVSGNNEAYKRHVFTAQVRVINPSSRRES